MIDPTRFRMISELVRHIKSRGKPKWEEKILVELYEELVEDRAHETTHPVPFCPVPRSLLFDAGSGADAE